MPPATREWLVQFGTGGSDVLLGVTPAANGDVWISGHTDSFVLEAPDLYGGTASSGLLDALVLRVDAAGKVLLPVQFGTTEADALLGSATTAEDGVAVIGYSKGEFATTNYGINDMIVAKLTSQGAEEWHAQLGGPDWDRGYSVAVADDGSVFVGGYTFGGIAENFGGAGQGNHDAVVAKLSPTGEILWVASVGTPDVEWGQSLALDAEGGVVIVGYTQGAWNGDNAGARDYFVARIAPDGTLDWIVQGGSELDDWLQGVAIASDGTIWAGGFTAGAEGSLGGTDMFLVRVSPTGELLGEARLGTDGDDRIFGLVPTDDGDVYVSGTVSGSFNGGTWAGKKDVVVARLGPDGTVRWSDQFGGDVDDDAYGLAGVDGRLIAVGVTAGLIDSSVSSYGGPTDGWMVSYRL
ncbi:MAG: hypothetical protein FGM29_01400 [Actinobacteria bacterium]|nr:hypothetical protein [Actinomycetota bacterium]